MLAICMSTALFLTACSQRPVLKNCRTGQLCHRRQGADRFSRTYLSRRPCLCFSKTGRCPEISARLRPRRRPVLQNLGNDARRTRGLPEHFSAPGILHLSRRSAPTGNADGERNLRRHYSCLRRGNMVQPLSEVSGPTISRAYSSAGIPGLDQFFRQMTPNIGPVDFEVYSDGYAALPDCRGPAVFVTHSAEAARWAGSRCARRRTSVLSCHTSRAGRCRSPKGKCRKRGNTSPVPMPAKASRSRWMYSWAIPKSDPYLLWRQPCRRRTNDRNCTSGCAACI